MNLVLFAHPGFTPYASMARFADMLAGAYRARGHSVTLWAPQPRVHRRVPPGALSKWAGYVDQYLLFPSWVRAAVRGQPADTLYVFCDQALGPWMPLVAHRPHVVHCHDLLALRSALGDIPENPTSFTGKVYQRYIRRGFRRARHFISISRKSREDLQRFGKCRPVTSEVVYNGLNHPYAPLAAGEARGMLRAAGLPCEERGMLLHVSGAQWNKNIAGILALYAAYAHQDPDPLPLWMVSPPPDAASRAAIARLPAGGRVLYVSNLDARVLQAAYSQARAFIVPSHAEGFGWPIIEAQACGCPVLTTDEPPMNEIGGPAARYLPRLHAAGDMQAWAAAGAEVLGSLLALDDAARQRLQAECVAWAARFTADAAIDAYLRIYRQVLAAELGHALDTPATADRTA